MKLSSMALAMLCVAPMAAQADTPPPDICHDMAAEIRGQKTHVDLWKWPGIETEHTLNTIGGDAGFHPVLQADKARLLKEAAANDPTRADLWRVLLASSAAEQAAAEAAMSDGRDFQQLEVRELSSLHLGRLVLSIGGDLNCERISVYDTGADGKVHIPPQAAAGADMDGADACETNERQALYRWHGRVLSIGTSDGDAQKTTFTVAVRDDAARWTAQCRIDATYGFTYRAKPFDAYGARTPAVVLPANPHNVFMTGHLDEWGHIYRPYYDTTKPIEREAFQTRLLDGYARTHPHADPGALKAAIVRSGVEVGDSDLFIPLDDNGDTVLVKVTQGWLRQEPQPNVEFEMYALKDGRAILVGAVDSDLVAGSLENLTVSPL